MPNETRYIRHKCLFWWFLVVRPSLRAANNLEGKWKVSICVVASPQAAAGYGTNNSFCWRTTFRNNCAFRMENKTLFLVFESSIKFERPFVLCPKNTFVISYAKGNVVLKLHLTWEKIIYWRKVSKPFFSTFLARFLRKNSENCFIGSTFPDNWTVVCVPEEDARSWENLKKRDIIDKVRLLWDNLKKTRSSGWNR